MQIFNPPPPPVYLHDFRVQLPPHRGSHAEVVAWLAGAHARAEQTLRDDPEFDAAGFRQQMERYLKRYAPSPETVGHRYSAVAEFLDEDYPAKTLFPLHRAPEGAGMGARMDAFAEIAADAVRNLYPDGEMRDVPDEIIHVTCTGYAAPSAVQTLASERGWGEKVRLTHAYHMGCYAALPALRMARGFLLTAGKEYVNADIVHTEVCSLHLNPARHTPEQLVVQSLFADGFIRYRLTRNRDSLPSDCFELLGFREFLVPDSAADITWSPGDTGMRMGLTRDVPEKIGPHLRAFVDGLADSCGRAREQVQDALYAVHPGGPRLLDKVQEWLGLTNRQLAASRDILFEHGNMSSATLPHVWDRMTGQGEPPEDGLVVSLAFGPGITIYGSLMRRT